MPLQNGMIGFWPMNEGFGNTAATVVNAVLNATLSGATPPAWVGGLSVGPGTEKFSKALSFDGTSSWLDLTLNKCYKPLTGFSMSMWFARDTSVSDLRFLICGACDAAAHFQDFAIELDATTAKINVLPWNGTANINSTTALAGDANLTWHHVVVTWDGPVTHTTRIYLDGKLDASDATHWPAWQGYNTAQGFTYDSYFTNNVAIGRWSNGTAGTAFFKGLIGPTGVWNRALTATLDGGNNVTGGEVYDLYHTPISAASTPSPVVARPDYRFHPAMTDAVGDLNNKWAASPLASWIGPRTWQHVVKVGAGQTYATISAAVAACTASSATNRYAVLIANGNYDEQVRTHNVGSYIDLIGESRSGVYWNQSTLGTGTNPATQATAWLSNCDAMLANLTIDNTGNPNDYNVHNDGIGPNGARTTILLNITCPCRNVSNGRASVGSGFNIGGDRYWHIGCDFEGQIYHHTTYSAPETSPSYLYILDCNTGCFTAPGSPPMQAVYFAEVWAGRQDIVVIRGGTHCGVSNGMIITPTGTPQESLAEIFTDNCNFVGGMQNIVAQSFIFTDLAVGSDGLTVTSASYGFGGNDRRTTLVITGGTGWTPGSYTIANTYPDAGVAAGAAKLASTPGTSKTGGQGYLLSTRVHDGTGAPYAASGRVFHGDNRGDGTIGSLAASTIGSLAGTTNLTPTELKQDVTVDNVTGTLSPAGGGSGRIGLGF